MTLFVEVEVRYLTFVLSRAVGLPSLKIVRLGGASLVSLVAELLHYRYNIH